jgi:hypothetical protein
MTLLSSRALLKLALAFAVLAAPASAERVEVATSPVPLDPADGSRTTVGPLEFRGGLVLTSMDARFGGFSGLRLSEEGKRLTVVTDEGNWLTARVVHDERGWLVGIADVEMGPLLGLDGQPLKEKVWADSESLARTPGGDFVVGFEHHHRLWRYKSNGGRPDGVPKVVPPPPGLSATPDNGGIESVAALGNGRLVALTEYWLEGDAIHGFFDGPARWRPFSYLFSGAYRPADMTRLANGDLLILERAYNPDRGIVGVRLQRLPYGRLRQRARVTSDTVAQLDPPLTVDNYEGIDAVPGDNGETLIYLVSDNNFRVGDQRTLLMMFALPRK